MPCSVRAAGGDSYSAVWAMPPFDAGSRLFAMTSGCDLPIRPALGEPLPGVAPISLQLSPSPDPGRAFGLAPFHGRRDPREGIGGGHHGERAYS